MGFTHFLKHYPQMGICRFKQIARNHEKQEKKKGSHFRNYLIQRAENGTQTRDPQLGRLVLYRLSYFRVMQVFPFRRLYVFSLSESYSKNFPWQDRFVWSVDP